MGSLHQGESEPWGAQNADQQQENLTDPGRAHVPKPSGIPRRYPAAVALACAGLVLQLDHIALQLADLILRASHVALLPTSRLL